MSNPGGPLHRKKSACGKLDSSNRACQIQGWSFSLKKSSCGKLDSSDRACQILGGHFHGKKSACGKTSQQHRACQILGGHFHRKKSACGKTSQQQQGLSGPGQSPVRPKNIKFGPNWVQNQRFGLKICPNGSYGLSGPIRTTPRTQDGVPDPNLPHRHGGPGRLMSHPHIFGISRKHLKICRLKPRLGILGPRKQFRNL